MGICQLRKVKVEYTNSQIKKVGKIIRDNNSALEKKYIARMIIDNWRSVHAYPLRVFYLNLCKKAKNYNEAIVSQRLKRYESIKKKLERNPQANLYTMQDLGGCRVILPTIKDVYDFSHELESSSIRHKKVSESDYINNPKLSGYRSLHHVYEYHSDNCPQFNGKKIEIQFRTHLQHLWGSALETIAFSTNQDLKAGEGPEYLKRFFALVSSLFAIIENCPVVPETSNDKNQIISELKQLDKKHHILDTLYKIKTAFITINTKRILYEKGGYYLLDLDYINHSTCIYLYRTNEYQTAKEAYSRLEGDNHNVVLVSAESIEDLKSAYPNYFIDIAEFYDNVSGFLT